MSKRPSRFARDLVKGLDSDPRLPKLPPDLQRRLLERLDSPEMQAKVKAVHNARALYEEVLAREEKAGGSIPMLQDWTCQDCRFSGTLTVGSRDKLSLTHQRIALIHDAESRNCHDKNGTRRIVISGPRLPDSPQSPSD